MGLGFKQARLVAVTLVVSISRNEYGCGGSRHGERLWVLRLARDFLAAFQHRRHGGGVIPVPDIARASTLGLGFGVQGSGFRV